MSPISVSMDTDHMQRTWTFDHVAGPETSQEAFFAGTVTSDIIASSIIALSAVK